MHKSTKGTPDSDDGLTEQATVQPDATTKPVTPSRQNSSVVTRNPIPLWRERAAESISRISKGERHKEWPEFLRLEYSKGAERYENIYKAVWQNFSYMAVVSAAILTFVTKQPLKWPFESIVLAPLVFWFWATYVPMDKYGNDTRKRLADIEHQINEVFFPSVGDPQLIHYTNFKTPSRLRVKHVVWVAGLLVSFFFLRPLVLPLIQAKKTETVEQTAPSSAIVNFSNDSQRVTIDFGPPRADSAARRLAELQLAVTAQIRSIDSLLAVLSRQK
jgi:hypothetical protein